MLPTWVHLLPCGMIESFIKALKKLPSTAEVDNLYRGNSKLARLRRKNLEIYLKRMQELQPRYLLVGEAPGYKGCKLTGVPFSCEELLMIQEPHPVLGIEHKYQCFHTENLEKERSAQMVWTELNKYSEVPLIWNIFPYHPHKANHPNSNRAPRVSELRMGQAFIQRLVKIYPITHLAAVGRKAHQGILEMDISPIEVQYIRHPSYGGKNDFVKGLEKFMSI